MKPVRSRPGRLVPLLLIVLGAILGRSRFVGTTPAVAAPASQSVDAAASPNSPVASAESAGRRASDLDLSSVASEAHRQQIQRVVDSMDQTGAPPSGVVQGGRGLKGLFQNAEGRLPRQPAGYWIESDVWPKKGPRDAERLIFGRSREVYWTRDHYDSFIRLR